MERSGLTIELKGTGPDEFKAAESKSEILWLNVMRTMIQKGRFPLLVELLEVARRRMATDPRDRIFALRGMISDGDSDYIKPNYDLDTSEVFLKAARHFAFHGGHSLDFPAECGTLQQLSGLPSWMPKPDCQQGRRCLKSRQESTTSTISCCWKYRCDAQIYE
jgi:hypothetical protein